MHVCARVLGSLCVVLVTWVSGWFNGLCGAQFSGGAALRADCSSRECAFVGESGCQHMGGSQDTLLCLGERNQPRSDDGGMQPAPAGVTTDTCLQ